MYDYLLHIYTNYSYISYFFIAALAVFEGPIVSIMLGSIVKLGYLNIYLVYLAVIVGDIFGDVTLYYTGYKYGEKAITKLQNKFNIEENKVEKIKNMFHKNKYLILFMSKLTNGLGLSFVVLVTAGIVRIPFVPYFIVNLLGQLVWSGVLLFLGYNFVGIYQQIDSATGKVFYGFLGIIVVAIYLYFTKLKKK